MSVLHGLLLAPTVEYKNYTQLMWIGILVSVVVALAVFFVFFFISRKVRRDELAEEKRFSDAEKENREDREAAATPTREEPMVKEEEIVSDGGGESQPAREEEPLCDASDAETVCSESDASENGEVQDVGAPAVSDGRENVSDDAAAEEEISPAEEEETFQALTKESQAEQPARQEEPVSPSAEAVAEEVDAVYESRSAVAATVAAVKEEETREVPLLPEFAKKILAELSEEDARAFEYYIVNGSESFKTKVKYPLGLYEKEKDFLKDFFVSYAKYKKLLSADAFEKLYDRYASTVRDDRVRTKLNNKLINVLYFYRKADEENLAKCKALCKKDVSLNFDKIDVRDCKVPALKRLIIIEAGEKNYQEAVRLCELAISRNIADKKDEGFEARRDKLEQKLERQRRKEERQRKLFEGETLNQK